MENKTKIKILYVVTKGAWGGAQRYVFDLATSLSSSEYEPVVAFGVPGDLETRLQSKGIRTITIPKLGRDISLFKDYTSFKELVKIFKQEQPNIIHLNSSKIGGLGALAGRVAGVKKIIFTAHGWPFGEDRSPISKKIIKFVSWITVVLSHKTITLHERDLHAFDNWPLTRGKIVKIYNGIRNEKLCPKDEARKKLFGDYGIPFSDCLIGTTAELHRNKGLPYLVEAMRKVSGNSILCIVGEGEERKKLESFIRREHLDKRIFLPGFIPDISNLLPAFDVFVLPSIKEGFPFVVLEAGMAKVPIVATSVGGIPEIIEDKKEGLLVPAKNPDALADAINNLLTNKTDGKKYATAFAIKIKEKFDFEKVTLPQTSVLYR